MVFCFGEILLRMSPVTDGKWIDSASMPVYIGGAELNVATALSNWKIPTGYCTALPPGFLADEIVDYIISQKVDVTPVIRTGERIGIYYLPQGADLKNAGVIYDRAGSSFASLRTGMIDWDKTLQGYTWFHFSAISPALNADTAELCLEALEAASRLGLTISVDLNYRAKLWQYGTLPIHVMPALVRYCDVVMGNPWSVETLLGLPSGIRVLGERSDETLISAASAGMAAIRSVYPSVKTIAYTYRMGDHYFAVMDNEGETVVSAKFETGGLAGRVGSGDCFMGGLIYGLLNGHPSKQTIDFAAAAAVGKLHENGDATRQSVSDVQHILSTHSIQKNG